MKRESHNIALRTVVIYLIISVLWIIFSDHLLAILVVDPAKQNIAQSGKGLFFVFITSITIYFLLHKQIIALMKAKDEHQKIGKKLLESEARYKSLFDNTKAIMFLIEPETGKFIDANPAAAAYYGWKREVLRHMHLSDINLLPPQEIQKRIDDTLKK